MSKKQLEELVEELRARAAALGFAALWVTDAGPFEAWAQAVRARGDGFGASLSPDPRAILPTARRVVALVYPFRAEPGPAFPQVHVSPYYLASHSAHRAAPALADWLQESGWQALAHPRLPVKAAAMRAGAGRYGRNGLLLTEDYGSNVALALLLTDAELPLDAPIQTGAEPDGLLAQACRDCARCVRACPVGALNGTSAVDTSRCLRVHMFSDKPAPEAYRAAMDNRLLGCDDCQRACPCNIRAQKNAPQANALPLALDALLGSDASRGEAYEAMVEGVGANFARRHWILAQAALLAGNSGDARYLSALAPLCDDENGPIREHARWAAEKLRQKPRQTQKL
ncbi:MAG: hypothetical protein FWE77_01350 [Clostridia bacterium]|nr:hypothetical protein [Clostridia bacterium]